ncbi:MAG: ABC transporter permease, partial [Actinomycetota bacterium]
MRRGTPSMTAVVSCARAEMRARRLSILALAILLGLGSGTVLTLIAGARRTDSAYGRFARENLAADMLIYSSFDPEQFANLDFDTVAALPQVAASGRQWFIGSTDQSLAVIATGANIGRTINRVKILEGRMPREDSTDEVALSFTLAKARNLRVGQTMTINFADMQFRPIPTRLRIVGIEASPGEFPPQLAGFSSGPGGIARVSHALFESLEAKGNFTLEFLLLRFKHGAADFNAVNDELSRLAKDLPQLNQNLGAQAENVQRSIHLQAVALRIVAALVALIALLVLSQLIARQASLDATESPTLSALGMTRRQVSASGLVRWAVVGLAGAIIGVVAAVAASPLMPIGTARAAEPSTGVSVDVLVLGSGAIATVLLVLLLAAWPMWKYAKGIQDAPLVAARPSTVARTAAVGGLSPAVSTGVSLALESGRGRTAVPVRSSLLSVTIAIVGLAAALTFGAGLDHLLKTPNQYGWSWDARLGTDDGEGMQHALDLLDADPEVEAAALVDTPPVFFGSERIKFDAIALLQHKGLIEPRVIEGRAPRAANEIAVGARTLREAHARLGSRVRVSISAVAGGGADLIVVGTVVVPPNSDTTRLGSGGVVTREGELAMVPEGFTGLPSLTETYLKFAPGVDHKRAIERLRQRLPGFDVTGPVRPTDLVNFGQVQNLPLLLAGLVAVLAAATLAQTLITSIRRRRRDLAILKMLGFVPRQVRWAVAWQATTFVSAALVIGLPIGIVVGRAAWSAFARQLGVPPEPATPSVQLLLTVPAAVLLANLIAAVPAVVAGRMR